MTAKEIAEVLANEGVCKELNCLLYGEPIVKALFACARLLVDVHDNFLRENPLECSPECSVRLIADALEAAYERCGKARPVHGHHFAGYEAPLTVTWLCAECHGREHREGARFHLDEKASSE